MRFGNLIEKDRDASKKVFTETLRQLEAQGLVTRHIVEDPYRIGSGCNLILWQHGLGPSRRIASMQ
ncbi:MAG: hypothetical protein AAGA73_18740 [Pseudomonadota bacterium]